VEAAVSNAASGLISQLEKELRDLWRAPEDPREPVMSRACTMNLEVVAPSVEVLERYTPVVDEVTASVPARAILASVEPSATADELTGAATAVCRLEGDRRICSERITLRCRGNAAARAASAIEAFLVPEIPTALVWLGRVHTDDPVFEDLANDANRIILDSEYTSIGSVIHVASWARQQPNAPEIADLAWTRIAAWQEMLARFFDDGDGKDLAYKITRIRLDQADETSAPIGSEAALLLGWIGTRLGWKTSRLAGTLRLRRPDGGTVSLEIGRVARPKGVAPHTLASLAVEAGDDPARPALRGTIERSLGSGLAEHGATTDADVLVWKLVRRNGSETPIEIEQSVRLGPNKAAKWLERTLHRPPCDTAFVESVAFAEHIVEDGTIV
jgi:glucose-6-phosphate dehydrogenase assembly protein OpcA